MKKNLITSVCIAATWFAATAQAAIIADYTFVESGADVVLTSVDSETNTTASTFASGAGFTLNQGFGAIIGTTEGQGLADGLLDNLADAITNNQYFTFTVNAGGATTFDLTSISFDYGRWVRGAQDFYLFSSVDGFTDGDQLLTVNDAAQSSSTAVADSGTANHTFSGVAYEGLTSVEFRIYVDDRASNNGSGSGAMLDDVVVNAAVTVPEASTLALLGMSLGVVMLFRRRTRN